MNSAFSLFLIFIVDLQKKNRNMQLYDLSLHSRPADSFAAGLKPRLQSLQGYLGGWAVVIKLFFVKAQNIGFGLVGFNCQTKQNIVLPIFSPNMK